MATKKKATELAKLQIVCNSETECEVRLEGDMMSLTAALAGLMADVSEENEFRKIMTTALHVVLFKDQEDKEKAKKKKAVTKKKAALKKTAVKKKK